MLIILENGPILIDGPIGLEDSDGTIIKTEGDKVALCRCGASDNKPFCDGSHVKCDFKAKGFS